MFELASHASVRLAQDSDVAAINRLLSESSLEDQPPEDTISACIAEGSLIVLVDRLGAEQSTPQGHRVLAVARLQFQGIRAQIAVLGITNDCPACHIKRLLAVGEALCQAQACIEIEVELPNLDTSLAGWYQELGYLPMANHRPNAAYRVQSTGQSSAWRQS